MKRNRFSMRRFFLASIILFIVACSKRDQTILPTVPPVTPPPASNNITPPPPFGFYVVGYFPSYRDPALVPDQKFRMCNVINYAFANVTSTGGLTVANPSVFSTVISKAKSNNAKIFISMA
jgi:chitinase